MDGLLTEFESAGKKNGLIRGYSINPSGCVELISMLDNIGYHATPKSEFHFTKRNVHFCCAASTDAQERMDKDVLELIGALLPDDSACVLVMRSLPTKVTQDQLPLDERSLDAEVSKHSGSKDVLMRFPYAVEP